MGNAGAYQVAAVVAVFVPVTAGPGGVSRSMAAGGGLCVAADGTDAAAVVGMRRPDAVGIFIGAAIVALLILDVGIFVILVILIMPGAGGAVAAIDAAGRICRSQILGEVESGYTASVPVCGIDSIQRLRAGHIDDHLRTALKGVFCDFRVLGMVQKQFLQLCAALKRLAANGENIGRQFGGGQIDTAGEPIGNAVNGKVRVLAEADCFNLRSHLGPRLLLGGVDGFHDALAADPEGAVFVQRPGHAVRRLCILRNGLHRWDACRGFG